MTPCWN